MMFGFARALAKIKAPRKQGYILASGKMGTLPDNQPVRYAANGNSLVIAGPVWPPVIRDDGYHDRTEFFEAIAEGLNNLGTNRAIVKELRDLVAKYEKGTISATEVTRVIVRIVKVLDENNVQVG
jgi:hypothetical protein